MYRSIHSAIYNFHPQGDVTDFYILSRSVTCPALRRTHLLDAKLYPLLFFKKDMLERQVYCVKYTLLGADNTLSFFFSFSSLIITIYYLLVMAAFYVILILDCQNGFCHFPFVIMCLCQQCCRHMSFVNNAGTYHLCQ